MKPCKAKKVAPASAVRDLLETVRLPGANVFEATKHGFQTQYLARRIGALDPALLAALASICFGEAAR